MMIGCCGLTCSDCQILEATMNNDNDLRRIIFERQKKWGHDKRFSELYDRDYTIDDIHCEGCPTSGFDSFWYIENCNIRFCALEKEHKNCAYCDEYPCDILASFFDKSHINAKKTLDQIRSNNKTRI